MVYIIVLMFLRLASLQTVHGRRIVAVKLPKPQQHIDSEGKQKVFDWKLKTRDLVAQELDLLSLDKELSIL